MVRFKPAIIRGTCGGVQIAPVLDTPGGLAALGPHFAMNRTCLWALALVASTGAIAARQNQPALSEPKDTNLYQAQEAGYHTFRIPAVIAARDGTLLAFAEARRSDAADSGDIDLVLKRSRDGGATWSARQIVGDNGPNTFGNPCPVLDAKTGVMWLLAVQNLATDREKDIIAGTSKASQRCCGISRSVSCSSADSNRRTKGSRSRTSRSAGSPAGRIA
jgi:hypothetical protein